MKRGMIHIRWKKRHLLLNAILVISLLLLITCEWKFSLYYRAYKRFILSSFDTLSLKEDVPKLHGYMPERPPHVRWHPRVGQEAKQCPLDKSCSPPDCHCTKRLEGELPPSKIPQMVLLTFDDEINELNIKKIEKIFNRGIVNPNGCPIAATFFVNHVQSGHSPTDYSLVQNLYAHGHEISSHTTMHSEEGHLFSKEEWMEQIQGQREILSAYGGVRMEDIRGFRAPYLSFNRKMYDALFDLNFTYDSTLQAQFHKNDSATWPITLDYKLGFPCYEHKNCPVESYPGMWEVPLVLWPYFAPQGFQCYMIEKCKIPDNTNELYDIFLKQFQRFYTKNRAPFGLFIHAKFLNQKHVFDAYLKFVEDLAHMDDVWIVTISQAIQWMKYPTPATSLNCFKPFSCDYPERPSRCSDPKTCEFKHNGENVVLRTCQACPSTYPWLGNTGVVEKHLDRIPQDILTSANLLLENCSAAQPLRISNHLPTMKT